MNKKSTIKSIKRELDTENIKYYKYAQSLLDPYFSNIRDLIIKLEVVTRFNPKNKKAKSLLEFLNKKLKTERKK